MRKITYASEIHTDVVLVLVSVVILKAGNKLAYTAGALYFKSIADLNPLRMC